jgi:hypothetical protein
LYRADGTVCKQVLINGNLKTGNRDKEMELTGRSPLRGRRSALDCSALQEEEEEEDEEENNDEEQKQE